MGHFDEDGNYYEPAWDRLVIEPVYEGSLTRIGEIMNIHRVHLADPCTMLRCWRCHLPGLRCRGHICSPYSNPDDWEDDATFHHRIKTFVGEMLVKCNAINPDSGNRCLKMGPPRPARLVPHVKSPTRQSTLGVRVVVEPWGGKHLTDFDEVIRMFRVEEPQMECGSAASRAAAIRAMWDRLDIPTVSMVRHGPNIVHLKVGSVGGHGVAAVLVELEGAPPYVLPGFLGELK